jgi:hypothetical protein
MREVTSHLSHPTRLLLLYTACNTFNTFYYPDQQMHNIYINILYIMAAYANALKYVGVFTIYKICCASVGLDNKMYNMHGTYIKMLNTRYSHAGHLIFKMFCSHIRYNSHTMTGQFCIACTKRLCSNIINIFIH